MDLKYRKRVTTSINKELYKAFQLCSDNMRIPQSRLFDEAIEDLLKKHHFEFPEKEALTKEHSGSEMK